VGRLLRELPPAQRPLVFTKCGLVWDEADRMAAPRQVLTPESIRRECEASLRRLGVERIDPIRHVDSLQPPFSLINRTAAKRELPWCAGHETGVIVYSPMQSGLLTDSFTADRMSALAEDDWRRRSPDFQPPRLGRNLRLRDALRPIADRHGTPVASIAIAWTLAWPGVTGAIVGARTTQQVDGWIAAASITLTPQDLEEIAAAIRRTRAGAGPVERGAPPYPRSSRQHLNDRRHALAGP
jgi:aryl-alcohol dehydrogenase-like predicted oxidoreductase